LIPITLERQFSRYTINSTTAISHLCFKLRSTPKLSRQKTRRKAAHSQNSQFKALVQKDIAILTRRLLRSRFRLLRNRFRLLRNRFRFLRNRLRLLRNRFRLLRIRFRLLRIRFPDHSGVRGSLPLRPVDDDESSVGIDAWLAIIPVAPCKRCSP